MDEVTREIDEAEARPLGWTPYPEFGSYYKVEEGCLLQAPMLLSGGMDYTMCDSVEDTGDDVAFHDLSDMDREDCFRIYKELVGVDYPQKQAVLNYLATYGPREWIRIHPTRSPLTTDRQEHASVRGGSL
jgi:hypothetical protein